jgi:hypothetical protein
MEPTPARGVASAWKVENVVAHGLVIRLVLLLSHE